MTKFQDEYPRILFWELWGWINPFEITWEKLILIENTFSSATEGKRSLMIKENGDYFF